MWQCAPKAPFGCGCEKAGAGARCEIHNPALLKQLIVNLLDKVDWLSLPVDVKGTIYEELLSRSAQDSSRGAGQYFTTRPVIQAMCEVMQPMPSDSICDPAGTARLNPFRSRRVRLSMTVQRG